jgi:hypothetical protein
MNGRAYDYSLGRFLSVDPIIQFPANSQSLNPYSYILNNPFAGTDPSGYACEGVPGPGQSCSISITPTGSHIAQKFTAVGNSKGGVDVYRGGGPSNGKDSMTSKGAESAPKSVAAGALGDTLGVRSKAAGAIPSSVTASCKGYSLPSSCGGNSSDKAVEGSAARRVASGGQLDPSFRNPDVAANTTTSDRGISTILKYGGDVSDGTVNGAAKNWSGDGVNITPARQLDRQALQVLKRSSRDFAADLCLATCTNGYYIGGNTPSGMNTIYINSDHNGSVQRESLTHELGHYFFGKGHPRESGDFLKGGIMDYRNNRVNDADRFHYENIYKSNSGDGP